MKVGLTILNKNLLILGAGGHGQVVKETAEAISYFDKIDFLDDYSELAIGKFSDYNNYINVYAYAFVGIGNNVARTKWIDQLIKAGFNIPVLIHPTAYISPTAVIETGTIVCARAVVNHNAKVKKNCIVSIGALLDHDSLINEGAHVNAGAIVKAGCTLEKLMKLDAGIVYSKRN